MKTALIAILLVASLKGYTQKLDTVRIYYSIDQSGLDSLNKSALDVLITKITDKKSNISVNGYADFLWKSEYNLALSKKRAAAVADYLRLKGFISVAIEGRGEVNAGSMADNLLGDPGNRRVDIITSLAKSVQPAKAPEPMAPKPETTVTYTVKPLSEGLAGESIVLEGLTFLPGRHVLRPEAEPVLQTLLGAMQEAKGLKIEIQGHVCCTPSGLDERDIDTNEKTLSVNRAKTVYNFLLANGIPANRMTYKGYGGSQPKISPEITEEDKTQNRRVEIMIVENKK